MREEADLGERQGRHFRFRNGTMDFNAGWVLGYSQLGGLAPGEVFECLNAIRDGDPGSWVRSFAAMAERQEAAARQDPPKLAANRYLAAAVAAFGAKGIILSGGPESTTEAGSPRAPQMIFDAAAEMKAAIVSHPELRLMGDPTFVLSFTSDDFDIYLVNDFMRLRGWRFNGQQYPNAIHMAVTRPQTLPGVTEAFATDLADAVAHAREASARGETALSGAIYGGVAGGMTDEADEFIRMIMTDMMDTQQSLPPV